MADRSVPRSRPQSRTGRRSLPATPSGSSFGGAVTRPPWQPPNAGPNHIHGSDIPPVLDGGRLARHNQNKVQQKDKYLLQSLRVPDDPNVEWRNERIRAKVATEDRNAPMPSIFEKLTNPAYYTGSHKHRFSKTETGAWQGNGLAGRREDTAHQENIKGKGKILRNTDFEMDHPVRYESGAVMSWDLEKLKPDAYHTVDMKRQYRSSEAFEDPVMDPETGIYGKLASEKVRAHRKETDQGEYEDVLAARKEYHVDSHEVKAFQVGV